MKGTRETSLAIHLLGLFRVAVQGKPVQESHWPRKQAKLLLKLLALDPKHQLHRQQLIDAIWPDLDVESGAANLHKMIHMARRALEPKLTSGCGFPIHTDSRPAGRVERAEWFVDRPGAI